MNKSESIKNLAIALSKFQSEIKNPANTATNPFFKSKYAPLNDVLNDVRPILSKHGLSIVQAPAGDGENIVVTTLLIHESGEWLETEPLILKADKPTAQGAGSAITYARRYALSAILGISSEDDDDGNHAEPNKKTSNKNKNYSKNNGKGNKNTNNDSKNNGKGNKNTNNDSNLASEKQLKFLYKLVDDKNYGTEGMKSYVKRMYDKDSSKDLTKNEASEIIKMLQELG